MTSTASLHGPAECWHCGSTLLCAEWSEAVAPEHVVTIWCCQVCDHEFETSGESAGQTVSKAELLRAFFPNLLVA
jgi:hypothetical protein